MGVVIVKHPLKKPERLRLRKGMSRDRFFSLLTSTRVGPDGEMPVGANHGK
jgi:hypothetical protein